VSLGLTALTGAGLLYYFQHLQQQKLKGGLFCTIPQEPCAGPNLLFIINKCGILTEVCFNSRLSEHGLSP